MYTFDLDRFVAAARQAAGDDAPLAAVSRLMAHVLRHPDDIAASMPEMEQDETLLFEDETVSVWHERFLPSEILPPHEHRMPAVLGVYRGRERNRLWRLIDGTLHPAGWLDLAAGEMHVLSAEDVHTVQALDGTPSLGLHVYLGPLSQMDRSLFDWHAGTPVSMTAANFRAMKREV
ncbi:hypothetical protein [Tranquillimonas alkanivorans]|uniref:Predicted metal-dependent enzyme of the double-stranded beta helix superfamily n=1 Tax=Tranquillimonas alkanivorans TaxID=441119 RepID=A0A1I5WJN1_9RHOB|nr:hypothetical protein [Tranquillimonas alkanivorans]SFQ19955.1 Predicted metal-dependent enzyme of the double-stranded beta helix superfamily [Tranquillimonas alkanivorans]